MSKLKRIAGQFRQGDVLVEYIGEIPPAAKRVSKRGLKRITVAHGEATGHHHSIDIAAADWWKSDQEQFVEVKQATALTHQEHALIPLAPGQVKIVRQREYSPEEIRNVAD